MAAKSAVLGGIAGGFILVDKHCINPKSGKLLFGEIGAENVLSHVNCFPVKVAFAKDMKDLYRVKYSDFFLFFK